MKRIFLAIAALCCLAAAPRAEHLVILHTNDTHSTVDPDRKTGMGGALRRKAIVDSVRAAEPNMMLVDAGDAVQGSLYFTLFGGEVERKLMNAQGYDIAIVGNHEFDNGLARLADNYALMDAELLASNYDFTGTPLEDMFLPYTVRTFDGRRIAFIAINILPDGLIDSANIEGVRYSDAIDTANRLARLLKAKDKADMVVAVTHIGYSSDDPEERVTDPKLAAVSTDIDIIIGGHSHTVVRPGSPESLRLNANGDTVLIAQTGKNGLYMGLIDIDLETLRPSNSLIPVDSRLDSRADPIVAAMLDEYRVKVDSVASIRIGRSRSEMPQDGPALLNLASDLVLDLATELLGEPVDFAVMNKGGVRAGLPKGDITRGDIMTIFPFDNRVVVVEMQGTDVRALFDTMASRGGQGVSANVSAKMDRTSGTASTVLIDGKPIDDNRTYRIATIDYLAKGNDYLVQFKGQPVIVRSHTPIAQEFIDKITALGTIDSPAKPRMSY